MLLRLPLMSRDVPDDAVLPRPPAPRPHEIADLRVGDGRRLRVRSWTGHGRPLVLLHGVMDDSEGWAQVAQDTHRPCVAIDVPGFGGSSLPSRPRLSAYADVVIEGLNRLALGDFTLVGHSFGGGVATAVAERCDAVRALALLAPVGYGRSRLAETVSLPGLRHATDVALPLALVNPIAVGVGYATFVSRRRLPSAEMTERMLRGALRTGPGVRMALQTAAAAGRSERGFTKRRVGFEGPVAALWGEFDALVPTDHMDAVQEALPQAHIELWRGMGHHPQRERPHQLNRYIEHHATRARRAVPADRRFRPSPPRRIL